MYWLRGVDLLYVNCEKETHPSLPDETPESKETSVSDFHVLFTFKLTVLILLEELPTLLKGAGQQRSVCYNRSLTKVKVQRREVSPLRGRWRTYGNPCPGWEETVLVPQVTGESPITEKRSRSPDVHSWSRSGSKYLRNEFLNGTTILSTWLMKEDVLRTYLQSYGEEKEGEKEGGW